MEIQNLLNGHHIKTETLDRMIKDDINMGFPTLDFKSIIIGTFNDFSYRGKALGYMARKVIREVLKLEK